MSEPTGKGFEVVLVDQGKTISGSPCPPMLCVMVDGTALGLLRDVSIEFEETYTVVKMTRLMYDEQGKRSLFTMTSDEWDAWVAKERAS